MIRGIHSVASKMAALRFDGKVAVVTGAGRGETKKSYRWLAGWVGGVCMGDSLYTNYTREMLVSVIKHSSCIKLVCSVSCKVVLLAEKQFEWVEL